METTAVILAAGQSKRMKSDTPKVLHPACGRPIIEFVLDAARAAGATRLVLVIGHQADRVRQALAHHSDIEFALQTERLGTGHAVMCARDAVLPRGGQVLILAGDMPLLRGASLARLMEERRRENAACVVGTARTAQNEGLGRIVRDGQGEFLRIVEQRDASPAELEITEVNTGCFAFDNEALFAALEQVRPQNAQGEYYLTDCAEILRTSGHGVRAACVMDIEEALGVNTQDQLAEVEQVMQRRAGENPREKR